MARLPVPLEPIYIGQMRRKVLDHAELIGRYERLAIMRPRHGADTVVVDLGDGFVVEGSAVPECELALVVAGQEAAAVGRPGDDARGGALFVDGGVDELV